MPSNRLCLNLAAVLAAFVSGGGLAQTTLPQSIPQTLPQTTTQSPEQSPDPYIPLFTEQQIAKASKGARKRMQATEEMNRQAWVERRRKSAEVKARKEAEARAAAQPAAPKYTRKGKIYKWVDAQGRVHFGDAPAGNNSPQIKLRNTSPPQGAPPPASAPHLQKSGEDS